MRGSATACHNMCALLYFFPGLLSFIITPTASSSFPSAFATARHGLGSIKGLVASHTGFSFGLSDLSSYHNDFYASDVDYADARRSINKIDNLKFDDSRLTKLNSLSSPVSFTSSMAIATTSPTSSITPDLSSTPRGRDLDLFDDVSDSYGLYGHYLRQPTSSTTLSGPSLNAVTYSSPSASSSDSSATSHGYDFNLFDNTYDRFGIIDRDSRPNELHQLIFSSCCELTYDVSTKPSSNKKDRPDSQKLFDTYFTWGKYFHFFYLRLPHCRPRPKRQWRFIEPCGYTILTCFISRFTYWTPNRKSVTFGNFLCLFGLTSSLHPGLFSSQRPKNPVKSCLCSASLPSLCDIFWVFSFF